MKGIRPILGDPADGVVELEYLHDDFPRGECSPTQLQEEINARGHHSFCCGVYEKEDANRDQSTVRVVFSISTPSIREIDQVVSHHVPHAVRLAEFQENYPRHWWALLNCGYKHRTKEKIQSEILQDGKPPDSTLRLLWEDAGKLETKLREGVA